MIGLCGGAENCVLSGIELRACVVLVIGLDL